MELSNNTITNVSGLPTDPKKDGNIKSHTDMIWHKEIDIDGKLVCKFCNLKYTTKDSLNINIAKKHSREYGQLRKSILYDRRNSLQTCRICKKTFACISNLKTHVHENHNIDLIKSSCAECDATFSDITELSKHMFSKHNKCYDLLKFICDICGYRTKKKSHLKQHQGTHDDRKAFSCSHCNYKTNLTSNLRTHEKIHTNERPFWCDFKDCSFNCGSKAALRVHQLKHYPEKNMLFCDKCIYKTVYRHSLKRHCESHDRSFAQVK